MNTPIGFGIARIDRGQTDPKKVLQANFLSFNWLENKDIANIFVNTLIELGIEIGYQSQSESIVTITDSFVDKVMATFESMFDVKNEKREDIVIIRKLAEKLGWPHIPVGLLSEDDGYSIEDDFRLVFIFEDSPPESLEVVYLKLYLLSYKKVSDVNMSGYSTFLPKLGWINGKPWELDVLLQKQTDAKFEGKNFRPDRIDHLPLLIDHIIPGKSFTCENLESVYLGAAFWYRFSANLWWSFFEFD